jgi:enoyl-CoA hydratase
VAEDLLAAHLSELSATLVKAPPGAMVLAKQCVDRGMELDPRGALATEILAIEENLARNNWRAGISGFGSTAGEAKA